MAWVRLHWATLSLLFLLLVNSPTLSETSPGLCLKSQTLDNHIIDIKRSVRYGAQLLRGEMASSQTECAGICCRTDRCQLAVFNKDGVSDSSHNCYLVDCGSDIANCKLVSHRSFVGIFLSTTSDSSQGKERERERERENETKT